MLSKKNSFSRLMISVTFKILWVQIVAILIYFVAVIFITMLFSDDQANVNQYVMLLATIITEFIVAYLVYKRAWPLGEKHNTEILIGMTRRKPYLGVLSGLFAMSPIIICWLLNFIFSLFSSLTIFSEIISYLLYPWSPYIDLVRQWFDGNAFLTNLFYLPTLCIVPIFTSWGYHNGMKGVKPTLITFKRRHYSADAMPKQPQAVKR